MAPEMFTCTHILEEPEAMTVAFLIQEKQHESPPFPHIHKALTKIKIWNKVMNVKCWLTADYSEWCLLLLPGSKIL